MSGYTPIFPSLTTGSLSGLWPDIGLWAVMLSLADKNGVVDCTAKYISRMTGLALPEVVGCIDRFCQPDPESRRTEHGGARLVALPGRGFGWTVVNHSHYRERARKQGNNALNVSSGENARRMAQRRALNSTGEDQPRPAATGGTGSQTHTQTHTQTQSQIRASKPARRAEEPPEFAEIRQAYPKRDGAQRWGDALRAYRKRIAEGCTHTQILEGVQRYAQHAKARGIDRTERVQQAATFLGNNRGFLEDFPVEPKATPASRPARTFREDDHTLDGFDL